MRRLRNPDWVQPESSHHGASRPLKMERWPHARVRPGVLDATPRHAISQKFRIDGKRSSLGFLRSFAFDKRPIAASAAPFAARVSITRFCFVNLARIDPLAAQGSFRRV